MRLTVLGGSGAWPIATAGCGGYLLEQEGYRLLIDPGYSTAAALTALTPPESIDAVVVTHGHPDHCADLNPLLRARVLGESNVPPLPLFSPPGALDAVLALDRGEMLASGYRSHETAPGDSFRAGPFTVDTAGLPHHVTNLGLRITTPDGVLAYTGDTGPSPKLSELAEDADIYLAEATHPREVPEEDAGMLSTAHQAGMDAARAGVGRLILTHLWPGTDPDEAVAAARESFDGAISPAKPMARFQC